MVFNSIPQFPWPSSRTPHPTERNYFCIFTSNCPIWKNISAKTARSIQSPIHPYHQHKQINLQLDESLQNTPKKTHFTRHVTTRLSMLEAGNGLIILEPQAFVLKNRWLPRAANGQSSRAAKQNRHKPLFWPSLGCVTSKPFLKNVRMVYDDLNQPIFMFTSEKNQGSFSLHNVGSYRQSQ